MTTERDACLLQQAILSLLAVESRVTLWIPEFQLVTCAGVGPRPAENPKRTLKCKDLIDI
jgi:hypothetical protein